MLLVVSLVIALATGLAYGQTYPRNESIICSGSAWGPPSDWNPVTNWSYATGTIGLCYETLFLFNPLTGELMPNLAEYGRWTEGGTVYEVKLREGLTWQDGAAITAEDVKFTFELGQLYAAVPYSPMWDFLDDITVVGDLYLYFAFTDPAYQEWDNNMYSIAIVPKRLWDYRTEQEITAGANPNPVGSGAYRYEAHSQDRMIWVRNDEWWGLDVWGQPTPKYVIDIKNSSNNVALGELILGELDWSNNFLPGIASLLGAYGNLHTYFADAPYMLPANTAILFLNLIKKPMDDVEFRKAVAFAIKTDDIVNYAYANLVLPAGPTGLAGVYDQLIDQGVVAQYGFSYDPARSLAILAAAGYVDVDGDGFVEAPDGSEIDLSIIVPFGWTDWMESIRVIATSLQAVGIDAEVEFPDFGGYQDQLQGGTFDMAINNFGSQVTNTVWTYYSWLCRDTILPQMTSGNFGRYQNQAVFDLIDQLDLTATDDLAGMKAIISQIQEHLLVDMPAIPLWYNGAWFQANTSVWTNYPSEDGPHVFPITWNGWWQMGGLMTLINLEPAQ